MTLEIIPVQIDKEIKPGDDLVELLLLAKSKPQLQNGDILIFTQKIISKQEGQVIDLAEVQPTLLARGIASEYGKDARIVQLILNESNRIVRMRNGIIISETKHGFICANAGVDESNVQEGHATLLPLNAESSAQKLRKEVKDKTGIEVAVIISDTFGRPFREGQANVAIGLSGISSISDYAGTNDSFGRVLRVTAIAIVDEICSASELVMDKTLNTPIVIVRNYNFDKKSGSINDLLRSKSTDLFR